jgi:competence protein ComGC
MQQSGRSMIEMLGVLVIAGVLSVGALAGYSYAMKKHEANKVYARMVEITEGVMSLYAANGIQESITTDDLIKSGLINDSELLDDGSGGYWVMIGPSYFTTSKVRHYPGMVYSHTSIKFEYILGGAGGANKFICYKMMDFANSAGDVDQLNLLYNASGQVTKSYYADESYPEEERLPLSQNDIITYCNMEKDADYIQFAYHFNLR